MIGHYLYLAARNLPRSGGFVFMSIAGLAIGLGAALLIGLYVQDELGYERWLPDSDRIYLISVRSPDGSMTIRSPSDVGRWVAADFPQFEAVTRLAGAGAFFKRGDHEFSEQVVWADPNVFDVLRFPAIAGTLKGALDEPDTLVLTRRLAEKYFGRADPIGDTLLLDGVRPMRVTAVIEDLPSSTHLSIDVLASAVSAHSPVTAQDATPMTVVGAKGWGFQTYGLLRRGAAIEPLRETLRTLPDRHSQRADGGQLPSEIWPLIVTQIRAIHLSASNVASPDTEDVSRLYGSLGIGLLIVLAAAINFVTLRTALAMRRAVEVGVRKACGGNRGALFAQFMGEVFVHVCLATALGLALAAASLPALNRFIDRTIAWQTLLTGPFLAAIAALLVAVTIVAGSYPAFVLASFRPSVVTKARSTGRLQGGVRQGLVAVQFAIVVAVLIATIVVYRQTAFGTREALRTASNPIVLLRAECSEAFKAAIAELPGVLGVTCAANVPQAGSGGVGPVIYNGGDTLILGNVPVDVGWFEHYGYELVAGRFFSDDVGADKTPQDLKWSVPESVVLNEAGVARLGIASARAAIGELVTLNHPSGLVGTFSGLHTARIVGVVKNFQIGTVRNDYYPSVFFVDPWLLRTMSIKIDGRSTPETLDAIDAVWRRLGEPGPPQRRFFEETVQQIYGDLRRDFELFSVFAGVALLISALGLVGLAAHAAGARTREIGVRKVLGGGRASLLGLLMWQFAKPVLLANIIAWPAAYFLMSRWLSGFARRIDLEPWMFVVAALATLALAAVTVMAHAWSIASVRPVVALRHE
ncbi:MAG TPA: ABC transporter permease [Gammaproteobacteria bacterium]|nr:ABC transporter permease [Gammaproteobacteria bacterium]